MLNKQINPVIAINVQFRNARCNAKNYIIQHCFWGERTYYRKMKGYQKLTPHETEVIANAYKIFFSEPLTQQLNQLQPA